ncbi:patatin-like phospholipase family protein [Pseudodonghicola flavimaris]|uniref:Patatin-like phospholipase family protein n=1 Tax=Pseudodonghicola flavimaris TaxID=3050036 RepID=A0ABT7EVN9_9RHOB|nr:patatin-like phospholipase family protein [Pseudodonghicola flavimaris]MDK3016407.1 patatin-like phospholipase family protein [Pseudodonghicola flavimaris]
MSDRGSLGLALGSGGARGWCHIGVLRALEAQGVRPGMVAGCSMGALVGAAWAAGQLDALEDWARGLTSTSFMSMIDLRLDRSGLMRGAAIMDLLRDLGLPETIEELEVPFAAVATDMETGREVWLREGPLVDAVRASISLPAIFRPHRVDGRWLLDGGLINPVPVSAARALGARRILSVNPNDKAGGPLWTPSEGRMWSALRAPELLEKLPDPLRRWLPEADKGPEEPDYFDVVSTSIDVLTEFLRKSREAADPADLALAADLTDMSTLEFYRAGHAISEGNRIARAARDRIAELAGP